MTEPTTAPPGPALRRRSRALAALVAALAVLPVLVLALAVPSAAQDEGATVPSRVTAVDGTGDEVVASVLRDGYDVDADSVRLTESGSELAAELSTVRERGLPTEIVYVVDTANRTLADGTMAGFLAGIDESIADLPDTVTVGVVSAGAEADLVARLTTDRSRPADELRTVEASQGSALRDAVVMAADLFTDTAGVTRTMIILSAGPDTDSETEALEAEAALVQGGIQLIAVSRGALPGGVAALVDRSAGASFVVPEVAADAAASGNGSSAATAAEIESAVATSVATATAVAADRLLVAFDSSAEPGWRPNVTIELDDATLSFSYPVGVLTTNVLQLAPNTAGEADGPGLLGHPMVLYISVALAFVAISTGVWAVASMYGGSENTLDKMLARYAESDDTLDEAEVQEMLVQTALIRRAIDMTESFAEQRGFLTRVEEQLERANLPIRAGEAMFFLSLIVLVVFGLTVLVTGSLFLALLMALVGAAAGYAGIQIAARQRLKAFEAQLPDTLALLAGTLRAGYSLPQGLDAVSIEIADPMGHELRRAITEAQLGRELDDALANIAERLDSPDFAWAVMAIGIQREVGGNLAEVLLTVADTMVQRERLRREVAALTAEGRVSAGILAMMPPGLGLVMWVMNPDYIGVLFSRTIGYVLIGLATTSGLIGLAWMKKVITIDA